MPSNYQQLVARLADLHNLNMACWILMWDQQFLASAADDRTVCWWGVRFTG